MNFTQYFFYNGKHNRTATKYSKDVQSKLLSPISYVADSIDELKKSLKRSGIYDTKVRQSIPKFIKEIEFHLKGKPYRFFYTQNAKMKLPALGVCYRYHETSYWGSVLLLSVDLIVEQKHSCTNNRRDYYFGFWKKVNGETGYEFMIHFEDTRAFKARGNAMPRQSSTRKIGT